MLDLQGMVGNVQSPSLLVQSIRWVLAFFALVTTIEHLVEYVIVPLVNVLLHHTGLEFGTETT